MPCNSINTINVPCITRSVLAIKGCFWNECNINHNEKLAPCLPPMFLCQVFATPLLKFFIVIALVVKVTDVTKESYPKPPQLLEQLFSCLDLSCGLCCCCCRFRSSIFDCNRASFVLFRLCILLDRFNCCGLLTSICRDFS